MIVIKEHFNEEQSDMACIYGVGSRALGVFELQQFQQSHKFLWKWVRRFLQRWLGERWESLTRYCGHHLHIVYSV